MTTLKAQSGAQSDQSNADIPRMFDSVVVTADRENEPTRDVTSNVTILDHNDIKASTAQTLTDLLVDYGFNSVSYNDVAGVQIRGFGQLTGPPENTNTILILLDGQRTGNADVTLIGLENVDRIEIIRGPSAVQYGSSAMGGVINIITKRGGQAPHASLELGGGSDNLKREKLAFSGVAKGFDLALGATNYGRDDLTVQGDRQWYHTAIDHNASVNADAGYSFNQNNRANAVFNLGDIRSQLPNTAGIRPFSANTPSAPYTDYHKETDSTALSYAGNTSDKTLDWSANYSFGSYTQKPQANDLDTKFFNAQGDYNRSAVSASLGADDYQYESSPSSWTSKDAGLYATGKARFLAERLVFSSGLRFDSYRNDSGAFSTTQNHTGGSIGMALLPERWLKLRANYAQGFKVPSPTQVAGDGSVYYLPNASLQPEKSNTAEFGGDIGWKHVDASATWFHADWDNKIIGLAAPGVCSGGFGCYQYQNLKSSTLAGLEGALSGDLAKMFAQSFSFVPYVSFTWLHTRRNNDSSQFIVYNGSSNTTLPNTPDWMVNYGIRYNVARYAFSGQLNARYYGDVLTQDFSVVDYVTVFSAPYIHRPTGTVVDLSAEKQLAALASGHNKITVRVEINNLFDGANEMYWGYPGSGRSFYAGLRYDY